MSLPSRTHITTLPLTVAERLDAVCDRFEAACGSGLRPRIGVYLVGVEEPARAALSRELIVLDLHYLAGAAGRWTTPGPVAALDRPGLATGRHPFEAASAVGTLHALIEQQPLSPSRLNQKLPGALEGLMLRMLEKDPRRRPPADEVAALLDGLAQAPRLLLSSPGIGWEGGAQPAGKPCPVGRRRELAELDKGFASALAGHGLLVCVTGEPGMGKTTLVENLLDGLLLRGHSFHLARGCCSERLAGSEAYLPVMEALESLLRGPDGAATTRFAWRNSTSRGAACAG